MTKGILMFAHNNTEIDYFRMAVVNAMLIKEHLGVDVTIVTDQHSYDYVTQTIPGSQIDSCVDNIIINHKDKEFKRTNSKVYRDTVNLQKSLSFYNLDRADAYDISPYDETIMIDADYLILSNTLNSCWGSKNPLMMNYTWQDINFNRKFKLDRLSPATITQYWATVVYFNRNEYTKHFFELCKHIRENYSYYKNLYKWSGSTLRNDFIFSIAGHILNGLSDKKVCQLPFKLYKSFDYDDVHSVVAINEINMFLEKHDATGEYLLCKWKDLDLHVMNKWALNRTSVKFLELLL